MKTNLYVCEKCKFATDYSKVGTCPNCGIKLLVKLSIDTVKKGEVICEQMIDNKIFSTDTESVSKGIDAHVNTYNLMKNKNKIISQYNLLKELINN